ncbi:MAG TPA: glycosyltransferase family 2 protein [Terriglobales bacterium]|jgi:glycosyltransferase involved in cell wall biosynthesis
MRNVAEILDATRTSARSAQPQAVMPERISLPVSVIVAVKNEAANLQRCLSALRGAGEIYVVDSQSTDATVQIAESHGAEVVQFHYAGGWPKKRQWALDSLPLAFEWVFLLDADEIVTPELASEICEAINDSRFDGYFLNLEMHFLGKQLRHCGATFSKLSLFRRGRGRFECRFRQQDLSMCDMEVHEHVLVAGRTRLLRHPLVHRNIESLSRYIRKHDEYSNWESRVLTESSSDSTELKPDLFGNQAQRRRWIKKIFFKFPGSPVALFIYRYFFRLGFLDRTAGLIYCVSQAVQMFHTKAKMYERRIAGS